MTITMGKLIDSVQDIYGNIVPNCKVTVYAYGTTAPVDLFEDDETTPKSNPFYTDPLGIMQFNCAPQAVDIKMEKGAGPSKFLRNLTKVNIGGIGGGGGGSFLSRFVGTIGVSEVNVLPGQLGDVLLCVIPARSRIMSGWIRVTQWFDDAASHGYLLGAHISDGLDTQAALTVSGSGTLKNSFSMAYTNKSGVTDSASDISINVNFDFRTGGNLLSTLTVGQLIASIVYQAPE